jgi:hypothetical protein
MENAKIAMVRLIQSRRIDIMVSTQMFVFSTLGLPLALPLYASIVLV